MTLFNVRAVKVRNFLRLENSISLMWFLYHSTLFGFSVAFNHSLQGAYAHTHTGNHGAILSEKYLKIPTVSQATAG